MFVSAYGQDVLFMMQFGAEEAGIFPWADIRGRN